MRWQKTENTYAFRYMMDILPITDWSQESVRPALNLVLRRLERLFSKIYKKHVLRVSPLFSLTR